MAKEPRKISVAPGSDLAVALAEAEAAGAPIELDAGGVTYRVVPALETAPEEDIWRNYDPNKVLAALKASAGALRGLDVDKLIADLYAAREEGSRLLDRP